MAHELPGFVESVLLFVLAPCAAGLVVGLFTRVCLRALRRTLGLTLPLLAMLTAVGVVSLDKPLLLAKVKATLSLFALALLVLKEWMTASPVGAAAAGVGLAFGVLLREWWSNRTQPAREQ